MTSSLLGLRCGVTTDDCRHDTWWAKRCDLIVSFVVGNFVGASGEDLMVPLALGEGIVLENNTEFRDEIARERDRKRENEEIGKSATE